MKILVTGGAGYIGSVVVEQLVEMGEEVVVVDNLSQGHRQAVHPEAEFVEGDLSSRLTLNLLFEEYRPEAVMHFASKILVGAAMGAYADGLVAGALRLTADYVANRKQFGKPLSTFQTVAAQLAEVYIASRTIDLAAKSVVWRLSEGRDADDDLDVLGYWVTSQAPPVMQLCHHLHGGMGMDITYPMHRYYSTIKDLTRLLGGPSHRLDLVGAQCSST